MVYQPRAISWVWTLEFDLRDPLKQFALSMVGIPMYTIIRYLSMVRTWHNDRWKASYFILSLVSPLSNTQTICSQLPTTWFLSRGDGFLNRRWRLASGKCLVRRWASRFTSVSKIAMSRLRIDSEWRIILGMNKSSLDIMPIIGRVEGETEPGPNPLKLTATSINIQSHSYSNRT